MVLIILWTAVILLVLLTGFAILVFHFAMVRRKNQPPGDRITDLRGFASHYVDEVRKGAQVFLSQGPEEVTLKSCDGLTLKAWFLPCRDAQRTVICVHGYRGDSLTNFGAVAPFYIQQNCNLLFIDQRAHGRSGGRYTCFGVRERMDCLQWIDYVNKRLGTALPLYLDGLSMGSTTVLMAAGLELPENMAGIIADCGFTSPWEIVGYHLRHAHIPRFPVLYIVDILCQFLAGFSLREASATEALRSARVPVLFIHGAADRYVPTFMSRVNFEACASDKQLEIFDGASHGASYLVDRERAENLIAGFFDKYDGLKYRIY